MFNTLIEWIEKKSNKFSKSSINIEFNGKEHDNKYTVVFSINGKMASIELLELGITDLLIMDSGSEEIIFSETVENLTEEDLIDTLNAFYDKLVNM
jgi:hypothetical protein